MISATKILSAQQIRKVDEHTIKNEPIASIDLMERASKAFIAWFVKSYNLTKRVMIFCGTGNNGGDGLAISRLLQDYGYKTSIFYIGNASKGSVDFKHNLNRLDAYGGAVAIIGSDDFPNITENDVVIDALFGSGLSRPVKNLHEELIKYLNDSTAHVKIAVDIASGLFSDKTSKNCTVMEVDHTISFQVPKMAFLMPENDRYCGNIEIVDISLDKNYIKEIETNFLQVNKELIGNIFKKRPRFMHKGQAGKCLIVSGSYGKMGASILAARACLRAGAGLLTCAIPKVGYEIVQTSVPEAMVEVMGVDYITRIPHLNHSSAIGIGPGIGVREETEQVLKSILTKSKIPLVLDADALNILSENKSLLEILPKHSVLTPHPGEFERLVGSWDDDFHRLELQREFSKQHNVIVLLKGANTSICIPTGEVYFNSTGNPGMATGGSGDVLTGIITSLIGQGYNSVESSLIGGYLHGLSGDLYVDTYSEESLLAGDLIEWLPKAFSEIRKLS